MAEPLNTSLDLPIGATGKVVWQFSFLFRLRFLFSGTLTFNLERPDTEKLQIRIS